MTTAWNLAEVLRRAARYARRVGAVQLIEDERAGGGELHAFDLIAQANEDAAILTTLADKVEADAKAQGVEVPELEPIRYFSGPDAPQMRRELIARRKAALEAGCRVHASRDMAARNLLTFIRTGK